ncbi:unnamed protein product [Adineta steineri]|uniref:Uncharacterized protein n=1 Tax=Adineta steineri TaxID=433720 RepID=A0A819GM72_9BILA|nr:unnamed protein product [Adineta steineri]CAF3884162.1 unnamed protein product [Adineta steineri]
MATTTSHLRTEDNDDDDNDEENGEREDNSTLMAGFETVALGDDIQQQPDIILNSNAASEDSSSHSYDSNDQKQTNHYKNHVIRPFIDPGLIQKKPKHLNESWLSDFVSPSSAPQGAYSPISQAVKKLLPERTACRLGCRGANCKYERSDYWRPDQMAIQGIFSNWITDNILACSRPTIRHNELKKLFYDAGIRGIFNLESPDEHTLCGHGNHSSGFSYDPSEFMDVGIFVYNYAMEDYGTVKVETVLDIMKVMSFAMKQGKIAVHCHAGLGRTGFVICSYLVHEYRMTAHEAIHYIRAKRPGSVQMTKQIEAVEDYERFLIPKRRVFTDCADMNNELSLDEHLRNQQAFIHGRDSYIYKNIPRVVFVCAARLIELCTGYMIDTILITVNRRVNAKPVFIRENLQSFNEEEKATWVDFAPSFFYEHERLSHNDFSPYEQIINCMIMSIQPDFLTPDQQIKILSWKQKINKINNGIDEVFDETDPCVISGLLWTWLKLLKYPVILNQDFKLFTKTDVEKPTVILSKLNKFQSGTIELLAKMFAYIRQFTIHHEDRLLCYCIIHLLTHRPLSDTSELKKLTVDNDKLRLYLISEEANYQDKRQRRAIEHIVSNASLNHELLEHFETFFIGVANQFEQN